MTLQVGSAKPLDEITDSDVIQYPIWLWCWETGQETAGDETWQQPVINSTDVSAEMSEPVITFRLAGTEVVGSGSYRVREDRMFGMAVWQGGRWVTLTEAGLKPPIHLKVIPTIGGLAGVEFVWADPRRDEALRVG